MCIECLRVSLGAFTFLLMSELSAAAGGPTTSLQTEFLRTLYASVDPPQIADGNFFVFNVPAG
jgi:hypothetical protein